MVYGTCISLYNQLVIFLSNLAILSSNVIYYYISFSLNNSSNKPYNHLSTKVNNPALNTKVNNSTQSPPNISLSPPYLIQPNITLSPPFMKTSLYNNSMNTSLYLNDLSSLSSFSLSSFYSFFSLSSSLSLPWSLSSSVDFNLFSFSLSSCSYCYDLGLISLKSLLCCVEMVSIFWMLFSNSFCWVFLFSFLC